MHNHRKPHVLIFYKSKSSGPHNSYQAGGLSANAHHSVAVLNKMGVKAEAHSVRDYHDLDSQLHHINHKHPVTNVIIEAVWVTAFQLERLGFLYPEIDFVVRAHSKAAFIVSEAEAVDLLREIIELHKKHPKLHFSSNNHEFAKSLAEVYGNCLYLPNLYDMKDLHKQDHCHDILKIGSYGASRLLKLHTSAALAALQVAKEMNKQLEFYINVDATPGGQSVRNTIRNMYKNLDWAKLIEIPWEKPKDFQYSIGHLDLLYQLSATESYCLTAADAIDAGVPVVVGPAIEWIDKKYQALIDDTTNAAHLGVKVIKDHHRVVKEQKKMLKKFVTEAEEVWAKYLNIKVKKSCWL